MTRAVGRASHFSSQIHLTRVLALIYSAALPRGDVPHLYIRRLITQYRVREQKVQHIVFLSRSVLNYEFLQGHNHVLIDDEAQTERKWYFYCHFKSWMEYFMLFSRSRSLCEVNISAGSNYGAERVLEGPL